MDRGTSFSIRHATTGQSRLSLYPIFTALTHKRFILRRSRCAAMIRLIRLDSGTQPWLLVLVLTAHNRGGRSCQQSGRSLCHKMPTVIDYYLNLTLSWSWPPTIGAAGVFSNRGAPYTVQMSNSNTWPWTCLGLDRPHSGRSELSAIGALHIPFKCLTVLTVINFKFMSWFWPPTIGRSELSAIGALFIPLQYLTVITSQLHDRNLVLVLTAHIRGGRSCQQSGAPYAV